MALKVCNFKIQDFGGSPRTRKVFVTPSQAATLIGSPGLELPASPIPVTVNPDGTGTVSLQACADLSPAGLYYILTVPTGDAPDATFAFVVPQVGAPFDISQIGVVPTAPTPPAAQDSLVLHRAQVEHVTGQKIFDTNPVLNAGAIPESAVASLVADLAAKAADAAVVHNTGNEAVGGTKTFTLAPVVPASSFPESAITNLTADLAAKATDSLAAHLAGGETFTGVKHFNGGATFDAGTVTFSVSPTFNAGATVDTTVFLPPPVGGDNYAAINAAVNTVGAAGGGKIIPAAGVYGVATMVSNNGYNNVLFEAMGADWQRTGGIVPATTFRALTAAMTIMQMAPPVTGSCGSGGGVCGIGFDENGLSATCLEVLSWRHGKFEWNDYKHVTGVGLHVGVMPNASWTNADSRSTQHLQFSRQVFYNATGSGHAIVLDGDTSVLTHAGNASLCQFEDIAINHLNGDAVHFGNSDNLKFYNLQTFRHAGGAGWALFFGGGSASGLNSRAHTFFGVTLSGSGGTAWKIEGTDTATIAAGPPIIYGFDKDNSSPDPTLGTGATYAYADTSTVRTGFKDVALVTGSSRANATMTPPVTAGLTAFGNGDNIAVADTAGGRYFLIRWSSSQPSIGRGSGGLYVEIDSGWRVQGGGYSSAGAQIYPANEDKTFQQTGSGLLRAATVPSSGNGNNKDFAFSDVGDLYAKAGGAWALLQANKWDLLRATSIIGETIPRSAGGQMNQGTAMVSGTLLMNAVALRAGDVVSSITHWNSVLTSGLTHGWFALFDKNRNLLAWTGDDTSATNWTAFTSRTYNIAKDSVGATISSYTILTTDLYYLGAMFTWTVTGPTLANGQQVSATGLWGLAPVLVGTSSTGLTTTPPNPAAAINASVNARYHAYVS